MVRRFNLLVHHEGVHELQHMSFVFYLYFSLALKQPLQPKLLLIHFPICIYHYPFLFLMFAGTTMTSLLQYHASQ